MLMSARRSLTATRENESDSPRIRVEHDLQAAVGGQHEDQHRDQAAHSREQDPADDVENHHDPPVRAGW